MLTTIKGYYEKGQVVLTELPPVSARTNVLITFLTDEEDTSVAAEENAATSSDTPRKSDEDGYVVLQSGLGIDE